MGLTRLQPQLAMECHFCTNPYKTVKHNLFACPALTDIRTMLLPPEPDKWNTLYRIKEQLMNTCLYQYNTA